MSSSSQAGNRRKRARHAQERNLLTSAWLQETQPSTIPGLGESPHYELPAYSFDNVLAETCANLGHVVLGKDVTKGVHKLSRERHAGVWSKKVWWSHVALNAYAADRRSCGWFGDFYSWNVDQAGKRPVIPTGWIAVRESSSVNNNPRSRGERTFGVPREVDPSGRVYMPTHIKIAEGGRPAPRLHFYDDTAGRTGKIYVSYIGPHLHNGQTN